MAKTWVFDKKLEFHGKKVLCNRKIFDLLRYVEAMKHLERKADSDAKEKKGLVEQISKLQRKVEDKTAWERTQEDSLCRTCLDR